LAHAQEIEGADVESISKEVEVMVDSPAASPVEKQPGFLSGQTWQPWAQQMMNQQQNQHLAGQTWQPWAQPQNQHLAGQTWQPWAQQMMAQQNQQLAGQTWQPWAQPQNQQLRGQTWQPQLADQVQNQQLSGQTWQPQLAEQIQNQHLSGQTWQPWAQPQNQHLSGQTWQPWAQPQANNYLPGQTWQPWAQPQPSVQPMTETAKLMNAEFKPVQDETFSPSGSVKTSEAGVFPISERQSQTNNYLPGQTWQPQLAEQIQNQHLSGQTWQPWAQPQNQNPVQPQQAAWNFNPNYPVYYKDVTQDDKVTDVVDEEFPQVEEATTQDPSVFVPGAPSWGKSWAPMPGKKPGCFNRCKNRCGAGYGNKYGCRASCRGGCNLRPTCGRAQGKMVGNTMVCPFANKNNVINNGGYISGATWQPWAQPQNQRPNYVRGMNTQTNYGAVPEVNQALTKDASVEVEDVDVHSNDYAEVVEDVEEFEAVTEEPELDLEE